MTAGSAEIRGVSPTQIAMENGSKNGSFIEDLLKHGDFQQLYMLVKTGGYCTHFDLTRYLKV